MADPMYRQIADDLRRQIEAGELPPGCQLATETKLRELYRASRNTVRDAIKVLTTRGLVETRRGQGTFVVARIRPFVTTLTQVLGNDGSTEGGPFVRGVLGQRRMPRGSEIRIEISRPSPRVARELQLTADDTIVSRHQQRHLDEKACSLQTTCYPMRLIEQGATRLLQVSEIGQGVLTYLKKALNVMQAGYRDTITVRAPGRSETAFFGLPEDGRVWVFETWRTVFDTTGTAIQLTISVYPADRSEFVINVGDVPADTADPPATDADHGPTGP
jgi:GntR family transcriptional regulator